jgi:hypothetical protein
MVGGSWIVVVHLLGGSNLTKILILSIWREALCIFAALENPLEI